VAISDSSRDCIKKALEVLDIGEEGKAEPEAFQLWAKTKSDEAPYPLIGRDQVLAEPPPFPSLPSAPDSNSDLFLIQ
jgi:hypothetical protein